MFQLITDRSQQDVNAIIAILQKRKSARTPEEQNLLDDANSKGSYNYTDLNRVTEAMEYINNQLTGYGYQTGYQKIEVPHDEDTASYSLTNIIPNSSFEQSANWSNVVYDTAEFYQGSRSSKLGPGTVVTTSTQVTTPIIGHKYYGRSYIKSQGDIQPQDCRFELYAGDGAGLNFVFAWNQGNFPDWTMQSSIVTVNAVNGASYIIRNFVVSAINPCWTDCLMIVDLTAAFGTGNEPDKAWCDANLPYFSGQYTYTPPLKDPYTWYETDIPTEELMDAYLANVEALRSTLGVLESTPQTPESMEALTWVEANNIEQILLDVQQMINQVVESFSRSNAYTFWSGYRPLPSSKTDYGRTWAQLDSMYVPWSNLDAVDWYLLNYGNLEVTQ